MVIHKADCPDLACNNKLMVGSVTVFWEIKIVCLSLYLGVHAHEK